MPVASGRVLCSLEQVQVQDLFDAASCVVGREGCLYIKDGKAEGSERQKDALQFTQPKKGGAQTALRWA